MLDTHIAVGLFEGKTSGVSARARRVLDQEALCISPAVVLEIEFLHEIGRLRFGADHVTLYLKRELNVQPANERFGEVVRHALGLSFSRDPFDRLIAAHALLLRAPLITLDQNILKNYPQAIA